MRHGAGAVAGLIGGLASAVLLQLLHVSSGAGAAEPALSIVGSAVHTTSETVAWVAYLSYALVIGAVFGWLLSRQDIDERTGLAWGGLYGAFWWILSGLVLIPALRGTAPLTPAAIDVVRAGSFAWLAASILDGLVLGGVFAVLGRYLGRRPARAVAAGPTRRAA